MAREEVMRRRRGYVEEYLVPFESHGLGTIALGIGLVTVGGGVLWLLLIVGWNAKRHPGVSVHLTMVIMSGLVTIGGLLALIAGVMTCRRPNPPRIFRLDHSKRVIELVGFDAGKFALLIPRFRTPKARHAIPFDELELAGINVIRHRNGRTETFYVSTRKRVYLIGTLSNAPELKHAFEECSSIIKKRRARNRELDLGDAPRPISEAVLLYIC